MAVQIQVRRDLAAQWTSVNPTLAQGEIGFETDTRKFKIGSGLSAWTSLPYMPFLALDDLTNVSAPAPNNGDALVYNSAAGQWVASAVAGGSGSVTSAEHVSLVDRVSQNSAQMTSADNAISAAVAAVSAAHTSLVSDVGRISLSVSAAISAIAANSAQMTSADNANSAAAAGVSARLDSTNTVVSNQGSAIVANSAQMTSADNAISAAVNVVSAAHASLVSDVGRISLSVSALNSAVNAISNRISTLVLDSLADVSAPSPADAQVLMWRSSSAQWVASTPPAGTVSIPGADGQIIFNSASTLGADADLYWERTTNALHISGELHLADGVLSANLQADSAQNLGFWFQGDGGAQFDVFATFNQAATFNLGATFQSAASAEFHGPVTFTNGQPLIVDSAETLYFRENTPAQITSNQTAWDPGDGNTFLVDSDASTREIQGILNDNDNRVITLINYGSFNILLMHENGAATAANRIATPDGGTFTLAPGQVVKLGWYETATGPRWVIMSRSQAGSGSGSVTSAELSAVSAAAASADATLSARINSVMTVVSNAVSAIQANSAQMTSADNAISAAAAAVSVRLDSTNTVVSNQGSAIVANSAQMTSADNAISAAAAAVSARLDSTNTVVSNQGSAIVANSAALTSVASIASAAASAVNALSVNFVSLRSDVGRLSVSLSGAISDIARLSLSVSALNSAVNAVSNRLSTWAVDNLADVSAPSPTTGQVLMWRSTSAQWVASTPAGGPGGGSVTSTELSAVSAAAASADGTLSVRIDSVMTVLSNAVSAITANSAQMTSADNAISAAAAAVSVRLDSTNTVVSNLTSAVQANSAALTSVASIASAAASAVSAAVSNHVSLVSDVGRISTLVAAGLVSAGPFKRVLAGNQVASATAPVSLSGFTFTVSADVPYSFEMGIIAQHPASTQGAKLILSAAGGGGPLFALFFNAASPAAVAQTAINATNLTVQYVTVSAFGAQVIHIRGSMKPLGNGTFALAIGCNTSGTAITFQSGSYAYVWRMG